MKSFIDRVFKSKQQKQKELLDDITNTEVIEENKEILSKQIEISIKKHVEEVKEEVVKHKKPNHFPDCNCFKCLRWKQHAQ